MRRLHHYFGYASDLISTNEVGSAWKAYERVDPCTFSLKTEELSSNLTALYKEYHDMTRGCSSSASSAPTPHDRVNESPHDLDNVSSSLILLTCIIIY